MEVNETMLTETEAVCFHFRGTVILKSVWICPIGWQLCPSPNLFRQMMKRSQIMNLPKLWPKLKWPWYSINAPCSPSTSWVNADSVTAFPALKRTFTLYRCQSERKCTRCSSTSWNIAPRHMLQALAPRGVDPECTVFPIGVAGLPMCWPTRFRGVRVSNSSRGRENTWYCILMVSASKDP